MEIETEDSADEVIVVRFSPSSYELVFEMVEGLLQGDLADSSLTGQELLEAAAAPGVVDGVIADRRLVAERLGYDYNENGVDPDQHVLDLATDARAYRELLAARKEVLS